VIEVRFHEELYDGFAIDEAVKLYGPYATFALSREAGGYVVKIEGQEGGADESVIAAELANYALGKTIERSRASAADAAPKAEGTAPAGASQEAA
jgi:hypothetical protein